MLISGKQAAYKYLLGGGGSLPRPGLVGTGISRIIRKIAVGIYVLFLEYVIASSCLCARVVAVLLTVRVLTRTLGVTRRNICN